MFNAAHDCGKNEKAATEIAEKLLKEVGLEDGWIIDPVNFRRAKPEGCSNKFFKLFPCNRAYG
jgi:hypothetical protein